MVHHAGKAAHRERLVKTKQRLHHRLSHTEREESLVDCCLDISVEDVHVHEHQHLSQGVCSSAPTDPELQLTCFRCRTKTAAALHPPRATFHLHVFMFARR